MRQKIFLKSKVLRIITGLIDGIQILKKKSEKKIDFIFICSPEDQAVLCNKNYISQILDPVRASFEKQGYNCESFFWKRHLNNTTKNFYQKLSIELFLKLPFGCEIFNKIIKPQKAVIAIGWQKKLLKFFMKNKIMTFEPIHGFAISKKDPIYGTKSKYNFPDVFLTFDDQSFKTLSCNKFSTAKIIQCQHPFRQRQVYFGKQKNKKQNLLNKNKKRYIILYTLQHGYDGSRDYLTKISNNGLIYNEVVETLKKIKDAFIIIKGHPVQLHSDAWPRLQKTLNELFSGVKNVDCKNYHFFDISYLLKCADLHITMSSGTITEAALFNVPSIGLCPTLRKGKIFGEAFISEKESAMLETTEINKNKILKLVTKKLKKRKSKNYIFEKKPLMGNVILNLSAKKL